MKQRCAFQRMGLLAGQSNRELIQFSVFAQEGREVIHAQAQGSESWTNQVQAGVNLIGREISFESEPEQ